VGVVKVANVAKNTPPFVERKKIKLRILEMGYQLSVVIGCEYLDLYWE